jgi:protein-disulfide isomerase
MSVSTRLKSILDTVSTLAVIVAAGVLVWKVGFAAPPGPPSREPVVKVDSLRLDAVHLSNVTGQGEVVIVEFTDFQCPFCGRHARDTFPALRKELIESGKARYASINYPIEQIHPAALPAAKAAECAAEQGKFWEMHERLFSDATATATERLDEHVETVGLESSRFKQCMSSDHIATKVKRDQAEAQRFGINSTPTFLVGRMQRDGGIKVMLKINGAHGSDVFTKAVEDVQSGKVAKDPA